MPDDAGKPEASWTTKMTRDRRSGPRYKLTASVELVDVKSGARIKTTVADLGLGGCQVHTNSPFLVGTVTNVNITKGKQSFETEARVVYSVGRGMGLVFTAIEPKQLQVLEKLLAGSLETSRVASNRRQSQRILMQVPVRVSGDDDLGSPFNEETHTTSISPHGALILLSTPVKVGQRLVVSNIQTKAVTECVVANKGRRQGDRFEVGVQFALPNPKFWGVTFPPEDWSPQHPNAKPRS
jgi:PilZ domain